MSANSQAAVAAIEISKAWIAFGGTISAALIVAAGGTIGALFLTSRIQRERNLQDRESQWRSHAIELTKLERERRAKMSKDTKNPGSLPISIFLAHYRDLQKLGELTPAELYKKIIRDHVSQPKPRPIEVHDLEGSTVVGCVGTGDGEGHPLVYLELDNRRPTTCPYCDRRYILPLR